MDFKKPSGKTVKDAVILTGGAVAGGMASNAAIGFIHNPDATQDATQTKKNENTLLLKRGAVAAVGIVLAAAVSGSDGTSTAVKGAGVGMAVAQGLEIIKTIAVRNGVTPAASATSKTDKIKAAALGLGCPCNGTALNGRGLRYADAPVYEYAEFNQDTMLGASVGNYFGNPIAQQAARKIA